MKLPGPDHPITVTPAGKRVRIIHRGVVVADTNRAHELKEAAYPPVYYVPRADAQMGLLKRTQHHTRCPYKGEASYFSIVTDVGSAENAVWTYEDPYPAVAGIKDHLAFYPNRVDRIETGDA